MHELPVRRPTVGLHSSTTVFVTRERVSTGYRFFPVNSYDRYKDDNGPVLIRVSVRLVSGIVARSRWMDTPWTSVK